MYTNEATQLRMLNGLFAGIAAALPRNLELLNKIEFALATIEGDKAKIDFFNKALTNEIEHVKSWPDVIDPDGTILEMWEKTRDEFYEGHANMKRKCEAAKNSPELCAEDGVVDAYLALMDSTAALHNTINDLCWAIGEHDADFDRVAAGGPYTNAKDLIAALES